MYVIARWQEARYNELSYKADVFVFPDDYTDEYILDNIKHRFIKNRIVINKLKILEKISK